MKQVVALLGSKRKQNTYRLLMQLQSILESHQIKLKMIELYSQDIRPCLGCECCILHGNCVLHDDMTSVMQQLVDADGIILASPVYLQQISGQLKTFFDRTCMWYHRPALSGKPILSVATTKGSGLKKHCPIWQALQCNGARFLPEKLDGLFSIRNSPFQKKKLPSLLNISNIHKNPAPP